MSWFFTLTPPWIRGVRRRERELRMSRGNTRKSGTITRRNEEKEEGGGGTLSIGWGGCYRTPARVRYNTVIVEGRRGQYPQANTARTLSLSPLTLRYFPRNEKWEKDSLHSALSLTEQSNERIRGKRRAHYSLPPIYLSAQRTVRYNWFGRVSPAIYKPLAPLVPTRKLPYSSFS